MARLHDVARLLAVRVRLEHRLGLRVTPARLAEFLEDLAPELTGAEKSEIVFSLLPDPLVAAVTQDSLFFAAGERDLGVAA